MMLVRTYHYRYIIKMIGAEVWPYKPKFRASRVHAIQYRSEQWVRKARVRKPSGWNRKLETICTIYSKRGSCWDVMPVNMEQQTTLANQESFVGNVYFKIDSTFRYNNNLFTHRLHPLCAYAGSKTSSPATRNPLRRNSDVRFVGCVCGLRDSFSGRVA